MRQNNLSENFIKEHNKKKIDEFFNNNLPYAIHLKSCEKMDDGYIFKVDTIKLNSLDEVNKEMDYFEKTVDSLVNDIYEITREK
ncbi:hypothetical protein CLNEO_13630 [Anaerotignum neopropionicum]|uniref:Uncharacterized protein n=1 Tax=Anaerotignum neopropionicum TaxID=36847 RepID=A0A136WFQ7_9FIRM|nr:hypothetical protein [Anaerotignum neopropionicum]KXL53392.1 hypothetical protein CLNEO_13630 [Anaerotignum neopropionicum]